MCAFLYFARRGKGASLLACEEVASDGFCAKSASYGVHLDMERFRAKKKAHTKVCAFLYFARRREGASLLACAEVASGGVRAKAASSGVRAKANSYGGNGITLERVVLSCRVAGFCGGNVCIGK